MLLKRRYLVEISSCVCLPRFSWRLMGRGVRDARSSCREERQGRSTVGFESDHSNDDTNRAWMNEAIKVGLLRTKQFDHHANRVSKVSFLDKSTPIRLIESMGWKQLAEFSNFKSDLRGKLADFFYSCYQHNPTLLGRDIELIIALPFYRVQWPDEKMADLQRELNECFSSGIKIVAFDHIPFLLDPFYQRLSDDIWGKDTLLHKLAAKLDGLTFSQEHSWLRKCMSNASVLWETENNVFEVDRKRKAKRAAPEWHCFMTMLEKLVQDDPSIAMRVELLLNYGDQELCDYLARGRWTVTQSINLSIKV